MPRKVSGFVDRALLQARLLVAAEAAAAGAIVAAWSVAAGFVVAIVVAAVRARSTNRHNVVRAIERTSPHARNVVFTADELTTGALLAKTAVRDRVQAEAEAIVAATRPRDLVSFRTLTTLAGVAAVAWIAATALRARTPGVGRTTQGSMAAGSRAVAPTPTLTVSIRVEPPSYTHLAPVEVTDPLRIETIERAAIQVTVSASAPKVTIDVNGVVDELNNSAGTVSDVVTADRSGYLLVSTSDGARRLMTLSIRPDALPSVRVSSPGRDLVYEGGNPRIAFTVGASDDFGLRALTLRYTKVSGSGEQFQFTDGEIPLNVVAKDARSWTGTANRTLNELALAEGDMLVYRGVAVDGRPGSGESSSDAFYIEVSKLGVAAGDAFTLPEQETRYALSQQMLIVKTERLNQRRSAMAESDFAEASQSLAVEQRMIRSEFVFMLGGEIEDEEVEAEQSVEIQAGRLVNRGQRDIRAATVAMSQAEKLLTGANTAEALRAERAAVEALQRAFARDRYILRALASRSQLDLSRRLTGARAGALGWRRQPDEAASDRRAALLQSLLEGLGRAASRQEITVLAELAIRTDPESAALGKIAADLQSLADEWTRIDSAARGERLTTIALAVSTQARGALADPPAITGGPR